MDLISRSNCSLKNLVIRGAFFAGALEPIAQCLEVCPKLTHLRLSEFTAPHLLKKRLERPLLLPDLTHLYVEGIDTLMFSIKEFGPLWKAWGLVNCCGCRLHVEIPFPHLVDSHLDNVHDAWGDVGSKVSITVERQDDGYDKSKVILSI
jgi:hypothetical protein